MRVITISGTRRAEQNEALHKQHDYNRTNNGDGRRYPGNLVRSAPGRLRGIRLPCQTGATERPTNSAIAVPPRVTEARRLQI